MKIHQLLSLLILTLFTTGCTTNRKDDHSYTYIYQHNPTPQPPPQDLGYQQSGVSPYEGRGPSEILPAAGFDDPVTGGSALPLLEPSVSRRIESYESYQVPSYRPARSVPRYRPVSYCYPYRDCPAPYRRPSSVCYRQIERPAVTVSVPVYRRSSGVSVNAAFALPGVKIASHMHRGKSD